MSPPSDSRSMVSIHTQQGLDDTTAPIMVEEQDWLLAEADAILAADAQTMKAAATGGGEKKGRQEAATYVLLARTS
eukprot:CAMPEP_0119004404 /NCGR_PEP_ID=MMETSP1176-20130426/1124_1 /TAXON_ID=265551 /ORGANISM="Synedropsis recta cf, Strain CCMP1620" /LENGTH=75 /DNA_ID=CAMNT_0006956103 /DNA_START=465 /DNA_END=692 /DNA_ORIENTATION=+